MTPSSLVLLLALALEMNDQSFNSITDFALDRRGRIGWKADTGGRKLGAHLGDKSFLTLVAALVYAKMIANWEGAKLIDHVWRQANEGL